MSEVDSLKQYFSDMDQKNMMTLILDDPQSTWDEKHADLLALHEVTDFLKQRFPNIDDKVMNCILDNTRLTWDVKYELLVLFERERVTDSLRQYVMGIMSRFDDNQESQYEAPDLILPCFNCTNKSKA